MKGNPDDAPLVHKPPVLRFDIGVGNVGDENANGLSGGGICLSGARGPGEYLHDGWHVIP